MIIDISLLRSDIKYNALPNHPSVLQVVPLTIGVYYIFETVGIKLPVHAHEAESAEHVSVIVSGKYKLTRGADTSEANAGDVFNFKIAEEHGFECVEPGRILNIHTFGNTLNSFERRLVKHKEDFSSLHKEWADFITQFKETEKRGRFSFRNLFK